MAATALKTAATLGVIAALGSAYVVIHEHRRKGKKERKAAAAAAAAAAGSRAGTLSRDQLIAILSEMATAAYQLIEQVCHSPCRLRKLRGGHCPRVICLSKRLQRPPPAPVCTMSSL